MSLLTDSVVKFRQQILQDRDAELYDVTKKLTANTAELAQMWKTIKRRSLMTDPWVYIFLEQCHDAANPPAYFIKNKTERQEIIDRVKKLAANLSLTLRVNDLDAQLIFSDSITFPGFSFYEDFGESNQASIDEKGLEKLSFSRLLTAIADRTEMAVQDAPKPGKSGRNARAVRFVRTLTIANTFQFQSPLYAVSAAAANALFDTHYSKSDARKLVKLHGLEHPLGWTI